MMTTSYQTTARFGNGPFMPSALRFSGRPDDDEELFRSGPPPRSSRPAPAPPQATDEEPPAPKGFVRRWLTRLGVATGLVAAGAAIAAGPLGAYDTFLSKRAFNQGATAEQEYSNSRITVDGIEYNGGLDPHSQVGYLTTNNEELITLTTDSPTKQFRNAEGFGGCILDEFAGEIAGHEETNRRTVDYIHTNGRTAEGKDVSLLIEIDNRNLGRDHHNLHIRAGAPLPEDCTDVPGNIVEGATEVGNDVMEGITEFGDWLNPFN